MTRRSETLKHLLMLAALSVLLCAGCGSSSEETSTEPVSSEPDKLRPSDVKSALRTLPFEARAWRVEGPTANTASFRGRAEGPHDTTLEFSIGVGAQPRPIPVPGAGLRGLVWADRFGFVFNDDSAVSSKFETAAQWRQVAIMAAEVNGSLCRAASGEPCPI